jgi:hypothetical protein
MKDVRNSRNPVIGKVGEFHHRELDNLIFGRIKSGCFDVQHDAGLGRLTFARSKFGARYQPAKHSEILRLRKRFGHCGQIDFFK